VKERVEKALEGIRGEIKVEEVRKIEAGKTERGNMVIAKLGSEDMRRRILMNKWKLKGGEIWVEADLTWEERRIKWNIRRIVKREELRGKRVRVYQRGVWIEGVWWEWDERVNGLRDTKENVWREETRKREAIGAGEGEERVTQNQGK